MNVAFTVHSYILRDLQRIRDASSATMDEFAQLLVVEVLVVECLARCLVLRGKAHGIRSIISIATKTEYPAGTSVKLI